MKDEERLELLKEVAGTTVYDEKKAESEKKMIENQNSMETIQETLTFMEDRLEELRGEKEELTIYQKLDRGRKSLAYTLYDKELRRARETLDEIEHKKAEEAENRVIVYERARNLENEITTVEAGLKTKTMSLRRNKIVLEETEEVSSCHVSLVITHIVFDVSHVINTNSTSIGPYSSHDTSYQVRASVQRRRGERRYGRSQLSQKQTRNRRAQRKNC
jgi:structural maintenance of chromosome 3 (chondroitin sulfate proteoglycan 6)